MRGVRIPDALAVCDVAKTKRSRYMNPAVSTINHCPDKVGAVAAELLFEQILNSKHKQIREEVVNCELVIRESSDRSYLK